MAFAGMLEDRLAIRELYGAYSAAAMSEDRDLYLSFWAEDGVRLSRDAEACGKAAIAEQWDGIWSIVGQMGFFTEIAAITVEGTTASAQVYCREIVVLKDGRVWKLIGRYDDTLEKQAGEWRFKRRVYEIVLNESAAETNTSIS
ncbi:ketosteroid isomerase-like protein [Novosphingobium sp. PhB165]|uniref:YybH family protein n=1 Tax=Novosphingobium sp. PhB165 TaxID=2485105 RepID=UPI00104C31C6|nr:nuclear transport factor 2 family protein [Novosphingobium sp. PhB165]TCM17052.1 ketosteroid isomerase-like protein [Novosphingobium sp. PhB165]